MDFRQPSHCHVQSGKVSLNPKHFFEADFQAPSKRLPTHKPDKKKNRGFSWCSFLREAGNSPLVLADPSLLSRIPGLEGLPVMDAALEQRPGRRSPEAPRGR